MNWGIFSLLGSGREVCSPKCGNKHVFEELGVRSIRWRKQNFKKIFKIKFFETKTFFKNFKIFKSFKKFQKNQKKNPKNSLISQRIYCVAISQRIYCVAISQRIYYVAISQRIS